MRKRNQFACSLACVFAVGITSAFAQEDSDESPASADQITELRQKAEADLKIKIEKLRLNYMVALEKLQANLAKEGDLDGAVAVKNERERIEKQPIELIGPQLAGGSRPRPDDQPKGEPVVVVAKDAVLTGGTIFDKKTNLVKGWSRYGATATWILPEFPAGYYKVKLNYHCGTLGGGLLSISAGRTERFTLAGSGSWADKKTYDLGVTYMSGGAKVVLSALEGRSREMIYVDSVELIPAPRPKSRYDYDRESR